MTEAKEIASLIIQELKIPLNARWIKLKEAVAYASIGKMRLKQLAKDGKVAGFADPDSKRGDWIFDRQSIDAYRLGQVQRPKAIALEIWNNL